MPHRWLFIKFRIGSTAQRQHLFSCKPVSTGGTISRRRQAEQRYHRRSVPRQFCDRARTIGTYANSDQWSFRFHRQRDSASAGQCRTRLRLRWCDGLAVGDEVQWDPVQPLDPQKLADYDAIVHLAGKSISGRWTEKFKREVRESRVLGTQTAGDRGGGVVSQNGRAGSICRSLGDGILRQPRRRRADRRQPARLRIFVRGVRGMGSRDASGGRQPASAW